MLYAWNLYKVIYQVYRNKTGKKEKKKIKLMSCSITVFKVAVQLKVRHYYSPAWVLGSIKLR